MPVEPIGTAVVAPGIIPLLDAVAIVATDIASLGGKAFPGIIVGLAPIDGEGPGEGIGPPTGPPTEMTLGFVHCRSSQGFFILCVPPNLGLSGKKGWRIDEEKSYKKNILIHSNPHRRYHWYSACKN